MTDHTCSCSYLTIFEYEAHAIHRNRSKPAEIWQKKLVKSNQVNLFLASSGHLEPLCGAVGTRLHALTPETLACIGGTPTASLAVWAGCKRRM